MKESLKAFAGIINLRQILIGLSFLLLGTLIYLTDRPPNQIYFIYKSAPNLSLYNTLPKLFGFFGNSLPSFIHVFSFILISAGLLRCQKRACILICAFWFLTDFIFEFGQKYKVLSLTMVPDWFSKIPFLDNTKNYFLSGTFDFIDLAAISLGTISAYFVFCATMKRRES